MERFSLQIRILFLGYLFVSGTFVYLCHRHLRCVTMPSWPLFPGWQEYIAAPPPLLHHHLFVLDSKSSLSVGQSSHSKQIFTM